MKERGHAGNVTVEKDKPLHVYVHNDSGYKLRTRVNATDDRIDVYIEASKEKEG